MRAETPLFHGEDSARERQRVWFLVLGLGLFGFTRHFGGIGPLGELPVELSPLLLGPAELLNR